MASEEKKQSWAELWRIVKQLIDWIARRSRKADAPEEREIEESD